MTPPTPDAAAARLRTWLDAGGVLPDEIADDVEELVARAHPERCCPEACQGGGCETCRCCCAGWCVMGTDGVPEHEDDLRGWLEVAAEHNPIVAAWLADRRTLAEAGASAERDQQSNRLAEANRIIREAWEALPSSVRHLVVGDGATLASCIRAIPDGGADAIAELVRRMDYANSQADQWRKEAASERAAGEQRIADLQAEYRRIDKVRDRLERAKREAKEARAGLGGAAAEEPTDA